MNEATFSNPPVVEFMLGIQFSPLVNFSVGHFGLFWEMLGEDWTRPEDGPPIPDQYEMFDRPRWSQQRGIRFRFESGLPVARFILNHRDEDRLIQLQPTRLHLNWTKTATLKPNYKDLIVEFETIFSKFKSFCINARSNLGVVIPTQWELTYIDSFPQGEYWETPADWSKFLPGLFGKLFDTSGTELVLEHRAAEWSYEISPKRGRLHITASPGKWRSDDRDTLLLNTTARGPVEKSDDISDVRRGFDLGHNVAIKSFMKIVNPEYFGKWGAPQ